MMAKSQQYLYNFIITHRLGYNIVLHDLALATHTRHIIIMHIIILLYKYYTSPRVCRVLLILLRIALFTRRQQFETVLIVNYREGVCVCVCANGLPDHVTGRCRVNTAPMSPPR